MITYAITLNRLELVSPIKIASSLCGFNASLTKSKVLFKENLDKLPKYFGNCFSLTARLVASPDTNKALSQAPNSAEPEANEPNDFVGLISEDTTRLVGWKSGLPVSACW